VHLLFFLTFAVVKCFVFSRHTLDLPFTSVISFLVLSRHTCRCRWMCNKQRGLWFWSWSHLRQHCR